jgi:hypothetical protein
LRHLLRGALFPSALRETERTGIIHNFAENVRPRAATRGRVIAG